MPMKFYGLELGIAAAFNAAMGAVGTYVSSVSDTAVRNSNFEYEIRLETSDSNDASSNMGNFMTDEERSLVLQNLSDGCFKCTTQENEDCGYLNYAVRKSSSNSLACNNEEVYVQYVSVPEKFRRQGIATAMLQELQNESYRRENVKRLTLYSLENAAPVYKKFGFVKDDLNDGRAGGNMHKDLYS